MDQSPTLIRKRIKTISEMLKENEILVAWLQHFLQNLAQILKDVQSQLQEVVVQIFLLHNYEELEPWQFNK